jgi:hypothetical protein
MVEDRTLSAASRRVAEPQNKLAPTARGLVRMEDFHRPQSQGYRVRKPLVTVISGAAHYGAPRTTIDVTNYHEINAPARTVERARGALRSIMGPSVAGAAAVLVAIALSLMPASDGPATLTESPFGQSILHFPR